MSRPVVTLILPKRVDLQLGGKSGPVMKRLVCGHARVFTDDPEQLTSYEAQIDAFTKLIQENEEWAFVGMYTDRSGTTTKRREDFNRMIQDAMNGKIRLIITNVVITKGQFALHHNKLTDKKQLSRECALSATLWLISASIISNASAGIVAGEFPPSFCNDFAHKTTLFFVVIPRVL